MTKRRIVAKSHFTQPASKSKVSVRGKTVKPKTKAAPKPKPELKPKHGAYGPNPFPTKGWKSRVISLDPHPKRKLMLPQTCRCNGSCNPYKDAETGEAKCLSCGKAIALSMPPILRRRDASKDDVAKWREEERRYGE